MKKYVVKYKESGKVFGEYASSEIASNEVMDYIHYFNKEYEGEYLSPFDFVLEEVECNEVNEEITCFESAKRYLKMKGPNEKHKEALIAIDQLFTIAEAWNKADNFVPDFSNLKEDKYFPWFEYDRKAARFVSAYASYAPSYVLASFGCRLCFKTRDRATQFGKQFVELYNKVFL